MEEYLKIEFQNPSSDKRSIPFWSWNDKMDPEEVRIQIRKMKEAGVGGFFIHSRIGLETEYLGEEWMLCVKAAVSEAKKQGLYAWIYDEDRWPSGTAGGRVTACDDAYRCKGLTLEVVDTIQYEKIYREEIQAAAEFRDSRVGILTVYKAVVNGDKLECFQQLNIRETQVFAQNEVLLVVRLEVSAPSAWFNNETPPDNLNPDCVRRFVAETHEKYKKIIGEEFGKTVKGVFTDEPSLNDRFSYFGETKSWIPWTYGFSDYYKKENGYDFFDVLPCFYFETNNSKKIRHDYWKCAAKRYRESYFKVIGDWCRENNLLFSGHMLHEDSMGICTRVNGAIMPSYQYMDVPGIDMLCEQTDEYMTVKQCASVAHQLGKKQVLTETYGCTGWDFTFEGQKWIGDWQYVLGVNRRCQHLMLYSLRGCRKRDYPPNFNYNTNWWGYNKVVEDYFARLSVLLEQGDPERNILVLHPVSTAWSRLGVNPYGNPTRDGERDIPELDDYGRTLNAFIEYILRHHLDLDLGDESLIEQYAEIEGGRFVIGQASYSAIVIPPMDTILASSCNKLWVYMEQGGIVYAMEPGIFAVDGSKECATKYRHVFTHKNWKKILSKEELIKELEPYRTITIKDKAGNICKDVLYQLRKTEKGFYLLLVNNNREEEKNLVLQLDEMVCPTEMDLLNGDFKSVHNYQCTRRGTRFEVHLSRAGSAAFYLEASRDEQTVNTLKEIHNVIEMPDDEYDYSLEKENVLTLDTCRYRLQDGEWSEEMEVWKAQANIRKTLSMRQITSNGIEQRYKWITKPHPQNGTKVEFAFTFETSDAFEKISLAVERPNEFAFELNGAEFEWKTEGYLLDKQIQTSKIPKLVAGQNQLIMTCAYRNDMELEMIYLAGMFGVNEQRVLTHLPSKLRFGSWTKQGLMHYCGSVTYHWIYEVEKIQSTWLQLPAISAVCVELIVNGERIVIPWNFEQEIDITSWMVIGDNQIDVIVVGSPRNMMGPFHLKVKPYNTNADSFCEDGEDYTSEYQVVPYGIQTKKELSEWKK